MLSHSLSLAYTGVRNDFCRDFLPLFTSLGYELVYAMNPGPKRVRGLAEAKEYCASNLEQREQSTEYHEGDAFWRYPVDEMQQTVSVGPPKGIEVRDFI